MILTTAIILILAVSKVSSVVVYIIPKTPKIPCPGLDTDLCMELSDYASYNKKENNTNLVFLPGEHALTTKLMFHDLAYFSLTGASNKVASSVVKCYSENGSITFNSINYLLIQNITFIGCQEQKVSLVSLVNTRNAFVKNSGFVDGIHASNLVINNCTNLTVSKTHFVRNQNTNIGGALYISESEIQIIDCLFVNNKASSYGGAIFVGDSKIYIQDSRFINNTAMNGGALSTFGGFLSISGSIFHGNVALKYGGSLHSQQQFPQNNFLNNTLEIANSEFISSKAVSGGAILLFGGKILILNSSFSNNSVTEKGGGIYMFQVVLNIVYSTFSKNVANFQNITYGGAVCVDQQSVVVIKQSQFSRNQAHGYGGALFSSTKTNITFIETYFEMNENFINNYNFGGGALTLSGNANDFLNCSFIRNTAINGGAIFNHFAKTIHIESCFFYGNAAWRHGGALHTCELCHIQLDDSQFSSNIAQIGGAIYAQGSRINSVGTLSITNNSGLSLSAIYLHQCVVNIYSHLLFANNRGSLFSFATGIKFFGSATFNTNKEPESSTTEEGGAVTFIQSDVSIYGYFGMSYNSARFGGAMYLSNTDMFVTLTAQLKIFSNVAFVSGAALYCVKTKLNIFAQIEISWNNASMNGGGIMAKSSTISVVENQIKLSYNQAKYGGGIYLQGTSTLLAHKSKPLISAHNFFEFSENTADFGGAVFVKDEINSGLCTSNTIISDQSNCFFQVLQTYSSFDKTLPHSLSSAAFTSNTARLGGNAIYGGLLDRCSYSMFSEFLSVYPSVNNTVSILNIIATIDSFSSISSDPVRICFCTNRTFNCNLSNITINAQKGHPFKVFLVAVDQVLKPLPATILASVSNIGGLKEGQAIQSTPAACSELEYNIFSPNNKEHMIIFSQGPCESSGISQSKVIVQFEPCDCAIGFQRSNSSSTCECVCDTQLSPFITNCSSNQTLNKMNDVWFSFTNETNSTGFLIYKHCPYDYCIDGPVAVDLNLVNGADAQCAFNRSGWLCGSCTHGYSQVLGSSRCLKCTNSYLALIPAFAVAGVILVFFLLVLNMTVAVGTINGLVFYANFIVANRSLFLPNKMPAILSVFIAWINLDLGIETCFYDGMDMYSKTLIQVAFPSYILLLVVLIIVACKWSKRFSSLLAKRNPVATLATLILLSFTKFLRILTTALSFGYLELPDGNSSIVWLPDGSVPFLATTQAFRFITVAVILTAGIGYIFLLLFEHRCQKYTEWRLLKCLKNTKLHGFMDTYYAPFNPSHRYWVGLLLFVRILFFVLVAAVLNSNPLLQKDAILLVVIALVFFLILLKQLRVRVYKNWIIDFLETSFLINLGILADGTYHNLTSETNKESFAQLVLASVSVSVAFVTFLATCCYHLHTFVLPESWTIRLKKLVVRLICCQLQGNLQQNARINIPYVAIMDEARDERNSCPEQVHGSRDSTVRNPNLDELAPLTTQDLIMAQQQQLQTISPRQPQYNNVTCSFVDRKQLPYISGIV